MKREKYLWTGGILALPDFRFNRTSRKKRKGLVQTDYIIAVGIFVVIFALVVQYVTNYFGTIGDQTRIRVMSAQATDLLDVAERGYQPESWPQQTANDSVLMLLHMDNSTFDSAKYGNNGTINGGVNCSAVSGKLDNACSFDGINGVINASDQPNINFSTSASFSAEAWVNPQALAGASWTILSKENTASSAGWRLFLNTTSRELMATLTDGTNSITLTSYNNVTNNSWSHVALTVDRAGNTSSLYLNGAAVNSSANISTVGSLRNNEPARIGAIGSGQYFNGSIDEAIIYNMSLSSDEIYTHWAYENVLGRIGLATKAYRFYIIVNDTKTFWKNQSLPVETITNELVKFNYTTFAVGANVPSTVVYLSDGTPVNYQLSGNTITFSSNVAVNSTNIYNIYFDDDSDFVEQTSTVNGVDNLTEISGPIEIFPLLQYRKLIFLNNSNYTRVKNATQLPRDFSIRLIDTGTSATILNFGPPAPPGGNVIAFRRFAMYQNSTAAIRRGRLIIQVW